VNHVRVLLGCGSGYNINIDTYGAVSVSVFVYLPETLPRSFAKAPVTANDSGNVPDKKKGILIWKLCHRHLLQHGLAYILFIQSIHNFQYDTILGLGMQPSASISSIKTSYVCT